MLPGCFHTGTTVPVRALCMGLDLAWFGGSRNDPDSRYDCLAAMLVDPLAGTTRMFMERIPLEQGDVDGQALVAAVDDILHRSSIGQDPVILALDAPLLAASEVPLGRQKAWRRIEHVFTEARRTLDASVPKDPGWAPVLQPGVPIPSRVLSIRGVLSSNRGFRPWMPEEAQLSGRLFFETYPSGTLWMARRQGGYSGRDAREVRGYKKLRGRTLTGVALEALVTGVLAPLSGVLSADRIWREFIDYLLCWMVQDSKLQCLGGYRGGKLVDDVIDAALCLAAAMGYLFGDVLAFVDPEYPEDGHILIPGAHFGSFPGTYSRQSDRSV